MSYMGLYFLPDALESINNNSTPQEPRRRWPAFLATALATIGVVALILFT